MARKPILQPVERTDKRKRCAVLLLNYRGSSGYNRDYWRAGNGEVFGAIVDDVLDAADWAISAGHTARDRIALFGGSFGGLLTLAVVAREPGAFRVGIAINAITDAVEFWKKEWRSRYARITWRLLFESSDFPEELPARESPLNNYRNIAAPLLLIAGGMDKRVPPTHSRKMFRLLKEDGGETELVEHENEGPPSATARRAFACTKRPMRFCGSTLRRTRTEKPPADPAR